MISCAHWDHTGGIAGLLERNRSAELYVPSSLRSTFPGRKVTVVGNDSMQIREDVFSTGELEGVERSLALRTERGLFVMTGCASHRTAFTHRKALEFEEEEQPVQNRGALL